MEDLFERLGFTKNEQRVYVCLAELGKSNAHLIAKRCKIPRTTAYSVLESLAAKGLVAVEHKSAVAYFSATNPAALLRLVSREKDELAKKELAAAELVKLVGPFFKAKNFSIPKIRFYEGKPAIEALLFDNLEEWRASAGKYDFTWWGYQDHTFVGEYRGWIDHTWQTWSPEERGWLLSNKSKIEDKLQDKRPGRKMKLIPPEYEFSTSIWVIGDYIVLLMTRQEPHYAFQLQDAVFAANLRLVFQLLWNVLPG